MERTCLIVAFPVYEGRSWKAIVVDGVGEGSKKYYETPEMAIAKLKEFVSQMVAPDIHIRYTVNYLQNQKTMVANQHLTTTYKTSY